MLWVDLDQTLIYAIAKTEAPAVSSVSTVEFVVDGVAFRGLVRPGALAFLNACREVAPVRLLTFASRSYAELVCLRFALGFKPDEITARDDWWESFITGPKKRSITAGEPMADVLVANRSDPINAAKMQWLGHRAQLITIPDFTGSEFLTGDDWRHVARQAEEWLRYGPCETFQRGNQTR
jgi:hypothetical protein